MTTEKREKENRATAMRYARKVESDPEYRAMRAEKEKHRRARMKENGESAHEKRKQTDGGIWNCVLTSARSKNLDLTIPREEIITLAKEACHYCGCASARGIDRMNNTLGYSRENILPACSQCNMMKMDMKYTCFLALCCDLARHFEVPSHKVTMTYTVQRPTYATFVRRARRRKLDVELSQDQVETIFCEPCYICGTENSGGVDREDSNIGYTAQNCRPCCSTCNYLKKDGTLRALHIKIMSISARHPGVSFTGVSPHCGVLREFGAGGAIVESCRGCESERPREFLSQNERLCIVCRRKHKSSREATARSVIPQTHKICEICKMDKMIENYNDAGDRQCKVCQKRESVE